MYAAINSNNPISFQAVLRSDNKFDNSEITYHKYTFPNAMSGFLPSSTLF